MNSNTRIPFLALSSLAAVLGCSVETQPKVEATAHALRGDPLSTITIPASMACESVDNFILGSSLAVVPDRTDPAKVNLAVSCLRSEVISFIDPVSNPPNLVRKLTARPSDGVFDGWGGLSYRAGRGDLLGCANNFSSGIARVFTIDVNTGVTRFLFNARNGALSSGLCSAISWDEADGTIWMEETGNPEIMDHLTESGALLSMTTTFIGDVKIIKERPHQCSVLGVHVVGNSMLLGCYDNLQERDKSKITAPSSEALSLEDSLMGATIPAGTHDTRDVECDSVTFASQGHDALWARDADTNQITAYELPAGTCSRPKCGDTDQSGCLVNVLMVPTCWSGTRAEFEQAVAERRDFMVQAIGLEACSDRVRFVAGTAPADGALAKRCKACGTNGLRSDIIKDGVATSQELANFQAVAGFIRDTPCFPTLGSADGAGTFWISLTVPPLTQQEIDLGMEINLLVGPTHEWGHLQGLGEEYCSVARGASATMTSCSSPTKPNRLSADLGCDESVASEQCCSSDYRAAASGPAADPSLPCAAPDQPIRCCRGNVNALGGRCVMSNAVAHGPRSFCQACRDHIRNSHGISCAQNSIIPSQPTYSGTLQVNQQGQFFLAESFVADGRPSGVVRDGDLMAVLTAPDGTELATRRFGMRDSIADYAPYDYVPSSVEVGFNIPLPAPIAAGTPVRLSIRRDGEELSHGTINGQPPVANAGSDATFQCTGNGRGAITVDGSASSDPDGDTLAFFWESESVTLDTPNAPVSTGSAPLGTSTVVLRVNDGIFKSEVVKQVTVVDNMPPQITPPSSVETSICGASAVVDVGNASAVDSCGSEPVVPTGEVVAKNGSPLPTPIRVVDGKAELGVGVYTVRWSATDGTNRAEVTQTITVSAAIQANGKFTVEDRGRVLTLANTGAQVFNSGSSETVIGNDALTGGVTSVGTVRVLHRARVEGNIMSATAIYPESDSILLGSTQIAPVSLPPLPALPAFTVPTGAGEVVNTNRTLDPGSYSSITVNSGASLRLVGGDYYFGDLTFNSSAVIVAAPTTRVFVNRTLAFRSPFSTIHGQTQPVFLGFAGTSTTLEAPFDGTLLAPSASVSFGIGSGLTYTGSFRAREISVRPASKLVCKGN